MLQKMHERMQGIITTIIIVAICLAFALWGIQYYLHATSASDVIAKVNGTSISKLQFQTIWDRTRPELVKGQGKSVLNEATQQQLKKQLLQKMTQDIAFFQNALKLGFVVNPQEIDAVLGSIAAFQVNGHFSQYKFRQVLAGMMYSEEEFIKQLQQNIIGNQLHYGIINSAFALPGEVEDVMKLLKQKRDINYAIIPKSRFNDITISEQDIVNYYNANKDEFILPEKIKISYIELNGASLKDSAPETSAQLLQYYNDNIELYTQPAKWHIQHIVVAVPQDSSVVQEKQAKQELAKLLAKNAFSKPSWIEANRIPKELLNRLQKLRPGQTSEPFRTQFGVDVIKVLAAKQEETLAFEQVKTKVAKALRQQRLAKLFAEQKEKLGDLTFTTSDSLEPAAQALGLKIQTTDYVTRDAKQGIAANPKVLQAAFSDAVLNQNYNSDPIQVSSDKIIVLRVKDHIAESIKPLLTVKAEIRKQLLLAKSANFANNLGKKIIADIKSGANISEIMAKNNLLWKQVDNLERDSKLDSEIVMQAFSLPSPKSTDKSVSGVKLANGDYVIVSVNKVIPGDITTIKNNLPKLQENLALNFGGLGFNLYFAKLVKQAKIKTFI